MRTIMLHALLMPVSVSAFCQNQISGVQLVRFRHVTSGMHLYTTDRNEMLTLTQNGAWVSEGVTGYVFQNHAEGTTPLYRLTKNLNGGSEHLVKRKRTMLCGNSATHWKVYHATLQTPSCKEQCLFFDSLAPQRYSLPHHVWCILEFLHSFHGLQ
jgi:hypothetical protein